MNGTKLTAPVLVRIFEPVAVLCLIQMTFLCEQKKNE